MQSTKPPFSRFWLVTLGLIALMVVGSFPASTPPAVQAAGTITVESLADNTAVDGQCTLREAMENAIASSQPRSDCEAGTGDDVITFGLLTGTVNITSSLPEINQSITLVVEASEIGGTPAVTMQVGGTDVGLFDISSNSANVTLRNLILTGANFGPSDGAAILNDGVLAVDNTTFANNSADNGGAIYTTNDTTITNSRFTSNSAGTHGGAIYIDGGTTTVSGSTFTSNTANGGGGIWMQEGTLNVTGGSFSLNSGNLGGGAFYNVDGTASFNGTSFVNNSTANGTGSPPAGGNGGAIYNTQDLTLTSVTMEGNTTGNGAASVGGNGGKGGAIYHQRGTLQITASTLDGNSTGTGGSGTGGNDGGNGGVGGNVYINTADGGTLEMDTTSLLNGQTGPGGGASGSGSGGNGGSGGNLYISGGSPSFTADIQRSLIANGTTGIGGFGTGNGGFGNGGGIGVDGGTLTLKNSTISGNTTGTTNSASAFGGNGAGIYLNSASSHTIYNMTLTGNRVRSGGKGGLYFDPGTLVLRNSILANTTGTGGTEPDCFRPSANADLTQVTNLMENQQNCGTPAVTADPQLAALTDNGGPTETHAITDTSPALNAGTAIDDTFDGGTDQRGTGFARLSGSGIDLGAFELPSGVVDCTTITGVPAADCNVLQDLYDTLGGLDWEYPDPEVEWFSTNNLCTWSGVTCRGGRVVELDMRDFDLEGTLPDSIGNLSGLRSLDVGENDDLAGALPTTLTNLANLQTLLYDVTDVCEPASEDFQRYLDTRSGDVLSTETCTDVLDTGKGVTNVTQNQTTIIANNGDTVELRITIRSGSDTTAKLINNLPEGLEFVRFVFPPATQNVDPTRYTFDDQARTINYEGPVSPGNDVVVRYEVTVSNDLAPGTVLALPFTVEQADGGTDIVEDVLTMVIQNSADAPPGETLTLVLAYYVADNDLAEDGIDVLNSMEAAQPNDNVVTLLMLDGPGTDDAYLYRIQRDTTGQLFCPNYTNPFCNGRYTLNENVWTWPDASANPAALADFLKNGLLAYPNADNVIVSLIGHGNGISADGLTAQPGGRRGRFDPLAGLLRDDNPAGTSISTRGLGLAFADALAGAQAEGSTRTRFDGLYLDACLMGMTEIGYELRASVRYLMASPNLKWAVSDYALHLDDIDGTRTVPQILQAWLENEQGVLDTDFLGNAGYPYIYVVADLDRIDEVATATNNLATAIQNNLATSRTPLTQAFNAADVYDSTGDGALDRQSDTYIDLRHYAQLLVNDPATPTAVRTAAQAVITEIDAMVGQSLVARNGFPFAYPGQEWNWTAPSGVSIYLPLARDEWQRAYYSARHFAFVADTEWAATLAVFYNNQAPPPPPDEPGAPIPRQQLQAGAGSVYLPLVIKN